MKNDPHNKPTEPEIPVEVDTSEMEMDEGDRPTQEVPIGYPTAEMHEELING